MVRYIEWLHENSKVVDIHNIVTYNASWQRSQLQPYRHWQEASPYCKGVLHDSPQRTPDFVLKDKDEDAVWEMKVSR